MKCTLCKGDKEFDDAHGVFGKSFGKRPCYACVHPVTRLPTGLMPDVPKASEEKSGPVTTKVPIPAK